MKTDAICSALVVSAPSSGAGKTTVVAALARHFRNQGKIVRVFKTGPDFIDPKFLEQASGAPVYQLDFWLSGKDDGLAHCQHLLYQAALEADVILIEGVMGMFDGHCSSADIASALGIKVLAVIEASAMAQTFGALAHGLATYRDDVSMHGVIANCVGSEGHAQMLRDSLSADIAFCGYLPKDSNIELPERHLGLVQAEELTNLEQRIERAAELIGKHSDIPLPAAQRFSSVALPELSQTLKGQTIAIAQDNAFSFIYRANIELLIELGATLVYFSPVAGEPLPECDALYLSGGYPELAIDKLAKNVVLINQIQQHIDAGKPALAECGGMLFLNQQLTLASGQTSKLAGVLNAKSKMQSQLAAIGMVEGTFANQTLRGHTFHYSTTDSSEQHYCQPLTQRGAKTDPVWRKNNLIASYIHWYFPSNPQVTADIFLGHL